MFKVASPIEDLREELTKRLAQCTNPQLLNAHIELCDKQRVQSTPACQEYRQLVESHTIVQSCKSVWDAICVAREDGIILDANGAFNSMYGYLIFSSFGAYREYITAYTHARDKQPDELKPLFADQYRIFPSSRHYVLMFDTVDISAEQMQHLLSEVMSYFNIPATSIIIFIRPGVNEYEVILKVGINTFYNNLDKLMSFVAYLKASPNNKDLVPKIRPKEIHYGPIWKNDTKYIKLLQTRNAYDGQLKEVRCGLYME